MPSSTLKIEDETRMSNPESTTKENPGFFALLREDVACVFERDPAARNSAEVLLTYPGVHAILLHRFSHGLWGRGFRFAARFLSFLSRMVTNIDIHPGATIGQRFFIDHGAGVVIGETAIVGDDVTLYHGVTLGGVSWNKGRRHPTVEDGVVIGGGAKVLGPITVCKGAKIGANSVVISEVPAGRTVVGIPARVVKGNVEAMPHAFGIDLNHHLIPDPVAEAVTCLMDRIRMLESRLEQQSGQAINTDESCTNCGSALCPDPASMTDFDRPAKAGR